MPQTPTAILSQFGLRRTHCRIRVLEILGQHLRKGLSEAFIESELAGTFDRATIYRTLNTFLESGVVHRIPDEESGQRFALCLSDCHDGEHRHDHIHFKCTSCGTTSCLDEVKTNEIALPSGFITKEIHYLISGECPECSAPV